MRIVFMGTPDFALYSLKALVESGEEVVGVVTQPDKPRGRGYVLTPLPSRSTPWSRTSPSTSPRPCGTGPLTRLLPSWIPS